MTVFHCHIATSLDGMIARPDGAVDWLLQGAPPPEAFGFAEFYAGVETILMGRGTYEAVRQMGDWPYPDKPVRVVTSRPLADAPPGVEAHAGDLPGLVADLRQRGLGRVWVEGGGQLLRGLLAIGALDRLEMAVLPLILGAGIPLFPPGTPETRLALRQSRTVGDALHLVYERA
ncbi:dihydrofolate reductase family protein [Falsiroseomonas tokyonensis]|uniref:Dihydrofolate reductase family protein n=1 Tax=Falsiroseomonas tokyonensis TaxID=430521 RepID=A0ABV7BP12_9PROT|nr:dihydrofolate reductase [Falsiroseomonas tokyonensis]